MSHRPVPGQLFPTFDLPLVGGGRLTHNRLDASFMNVVNVYRGLHCPRCRRQFGDFIENADALAAAGVRIFSVSTDPQDRAEEAVREWGLGDLPVAYGLSVAEARSWGLFISETIREAEPEQFAEAALFFIRPDGVLWGSSVNSFPFLRPTAEMILDAVATARARSYPPRGNVAA